MEECLEVALTVQLGVEEELAEEVMMVTVMLMMVKLRSYFLQRYCYNL